MDSVLVTEVGDPLCSCFISAGPWWGQKPRILACSGCQCLLSGAPWFPSCGLSSSSSPGTTYRFRALFQGNKRWGFQTRHQLRILHSELSMTSAALGQFKAQSRPIFKGCHGPSSSSHKALKSPVLRGLERTRAVKELES